MLDDWFGADSATSAYNNVGGGFDAVKRDAARAIATTMPCG
jgi:hypothetical protein